jgi:hypothetical protein
MLRLGVVRASLLALSVWACASVDSDAHMVRMSLQEGRRRTLRSRARAAPLMAPLGLMVKASISDSASELKWRALLRAQSADRGDNVAGLSQPLHATLVSDEAAYPIVRDHRPGAVDAVRQL